MTLEIRSALGSKLSKPGDLFPIRLVDPIMDGDRVVVPAGATGTGEVVHAKKAGGSGTGGELVLAARYLDVCGRQLRLRSLHMAPNGRSKTDLVNAINVASAALGPIAAMSAFLIRGGEVDVAEGTLGVAKTAQPFTIQPVEGGAASGTGCPAG
ncbi:hypothetical protein ASE86_05990 [Sphingomonas sp. Leaf33]|uniref:hypothetical protein n=1 Tax=Sphingomonas sp. Leaf33 TaxID=1736215 RepID=UPI0006F6B1FF|nr:hypothetical protein [Sphingomonas sp. Leaf33]KQN25755.1 hypothetical protein ASE86_05990 [Sphingomonas sp. Leaf33]